MAKENSKQKGNKPLTDSKISRNGLSAGTVAPYFCLPTIEGKEMTLAEFQGKRVQGIRAWRARENPGYHKKLQFITPLLQRFCFTKT